MNRSCVNITVADDSVFLGPYNLVVSIVSTSHAIEINSSMSSVNVVVEEDDSKFCY